MGEFLPGWISQARSIATRQPRARHLLVEAVQASGGVDALAALAREECEHRAESYLDWVRALRGVDRDEDAVAAAREALERLEPTGEMRAEIAEHLAELVDDAAQRHDAIRSAWRAAPTQQRLLALHHSATSIGQLEQVLAEEVENGATDVRPAVWAALLLLAGQIGDAIDLLQNPGLSDPRDHKSKILVPYLLAAGCNATGRAEWNSSRLAAMIKTVDRPDLSDPTVLNGDMRRGDDTKQSRVLAGPPLSELLTDQLAQVEDDAGLRLGQLQAALKDIDRQVTSIVTSKARGQYHEAALLIATAAEAVSLEEGAKAGTFLVADWRDRYPRHTAFRAELEKAVRKTKGVVAPPPRRAR